MHYQELRQKSKRFLIRDDFLDLLEHHSGQSSKLNPYLFYHFTIADAFLCGAFPSESYKYPKETEKNEERSRMPAHFDNRCDRRIDLKSSRCCGFRSDDTLYKRIHHWSTDDDESEAVESLFPSEPFMLYNTRSDDTSTNKKYSQKEKCVFYFFLCFRRSFTIKWYINHGAIL